MQEEKPTDPSPQSSGQSQDASPHPQKPDVVSANLPPLDNTKILDPIASTPPTPPSSNNTSGQGSTAVVPEEVKGWSWGAYFLNWIWGIANSVWWSLLMFVPFVNWVMPFVLGMKGKEWAWQAKQWESVEHFKKIQHKWDIAGIIIGVLALL
ncbi:hypothetical protein IH981_04300, partial [Patescibacteria group bacterium]|nr:hypothetical protein [Patescibacteria group bacterium]